MCGFPEELAALPPGLKRVCENSLDFSRVNDTQRSMSRFFPYNPEQVYLLPPTIREVLAAGHLCFFIEQIMKKLDLEPFERAYSEEGGSLYHPALMLSVWLYAYATGITSGRELERRIVEDLPLRHLAGGAHPDHWALSAFRGRHQRAINDAFTQVVEIIRNLGMGKLGLVAVDGTPIQAYNSKSRVDTLKGLRKQRAKYRRQIREWQKRCNAEENGVAAQYASEQMEKLQKEFSTAKFVKAFNSVGAPLMINPKLPGGKPTMFICGNDEGARKTQITDGEVLDGARGLCAIVSIRRHLHLAH